jgi:hypothetical protein
MLDKDCLFNYSRIVPFIGAGKLVQEVKCDVLIVYTITMSKPRCVRIAVSPYWARIGSSRPVPIVGISMTRGQNSAIPATSH